MTDLVFLNRHVFWLLAIVCSIVLADVPTTLNYQGTLADNAGQPINGVKTITFSLYNTPTGGTAFWSEQQSVTLAEGRFSVVLGGNPSSPIDPKLFTGETYIGITVAADAEMPRQKFTSVAYAFQSAIPRGVIWMWSGKLNEIPAGWALCDGNNGTPNLQGRFVLGTDITNNINIGATGGEAAHVLTINEMPSHTHIQDSHTHIRGTQRTIVETRGHGLTISAAFQDRVMVEGTGGPNPETNWTTATNQYTGGGAAHNNMPPYYALAFIMKL